MADALRQSRYLKEPDEHYLQTELRALLQSNSSVSDFLFQNAFDGIRYWDLQNREHEWISPGFWHALGYAPEAMPHITAAWRSMIDPVDFLKANNAFDKHCINPEHPFDETVRYNHADGHTVWFRCRGAAIRDDAGEPKRMLTVFSDISDVKAREQELAVEQARMKEQIECLEINNQCLKDFAAIVAHDLSSPLRQTKMQLSLLDANVSNASPPSDAVRDAIDGMDATLDRMRRIVQSLHELYRLDALDLDLRLAPMNTIIEDAVTQLKERLKARCASVNIAQMPDLLVDPDLVKDVFRRLLDNACKHNDADALSINITWERDNARKRTLIYVDDNGSGISDHRTNKIFEPYKYLTDTGDEKGSGIGLALCRRMMMLHRGTAYVDPQYKNGVRFVLSFPDIAIETGAVEEDRATPPAL